MKIRSILIGASLLLTLFITPATSAQAINPQTSIPPNITLQTVVSGLTQPVFATQPPGDNARFFIVQQTGQILILKGTTLNSTPFLDVSGLINCCGEQGLLGLAFDPNYATNGFFYIVYTNTNNVGDDVLYRYHVSSNPDVADPASATLVLTIAEPESNHNGGNIAFGPDGFLYFGVGDGGGGGDQHGTIGNGQDKNVLLGKMLRINVATLPYTIPPSNPFASGGGRPEIWSYGLRNPWRWSFDKSTGDLYIGDVGQDTEEEVDFQAAGAAGGQNYGWRIREGNLCYNPSSGCGTPPAYVPPVATYDHGPSDSTGCAVTGGYVYRGSAFPELVGVYFFGDYCSGNLWGMYKSGSVWVKKLIKSTGLNISSFAQDNAGELYILDYGGSLVHIKRGPLLTGTFKSNAAQDGFVIESGKNTSMGSSTNSTQNFLTVGDNPQDRQFRSILSFNTQALPDTAVIQSATLSITQVGLVGGDPFASLGSLVADIGNPIFGSSIALKITDFQAASGYNASAVFSSPPVSGLYTAPLANASLVDISLTGTTQFRLRFSLRNNGNMMADRANFASGESATGQPTFIVKYYVP